MRNKGFFWFLTILLAVVCIYQLSFTWVSNSQEAKAKKEAQARVIDLMEGLEKSGDSIAYLPNNTRLNVNKIGESEVEELAEAAYINDILKAKAETKVYPIFGSTFKEVKKRSLAFGLDLVGGMSVTLEISVPELVKGYVRNQRDIRFKKIYEAANDEYRQSGGDFIGIFMQKGKELSSGKKLVQLFAIADIDELDRNSTDEDLEAFLRSKEASSMDGVEQIMNRRINQFGVAQPNIQKDPASNRLYIELPGVQDEASVAEKLISTANLQFFETYSFQEIQTYWQQAMIISASPELSDDEPEVAAVDTTVADIDTTVVDTTDTDFGDLDDFASIDGTDADATGLEGMIELLIGDSRLVLVSSENRSKVDQILAREDVMREFPEDVRFMWGSDLETYGDDKKTGYVLYACKIPADGKARVGGKDIISAARDYDQQDGEIAVSLRMTQEGADKWAQMTEENKGRQVAITMDNVIYSAPNVINVIRDGNTQISGNFTVEDANDLAGLLNGGALPAPCVIKEQTKVGPTIGAENSRAGLMSFGFALLLVFVYMVFYYGKAGLVADIALFANILFIFGSLASFGAVLTLAGIAGIVLTIGMAVDANVLIFERIREEQAAGKDLKSAIDTGFKKALSSIIDANVTTMLTAIVLKIFGSGPIESFATTLIIGIFTSVFAALVISRLTINWWLNRGKSINFESKMTKGAFKNFAIDFVGKRKMFYMISGVLIVGGVVVLFARGLNPSVEFSGGRTFGVKFEQSASEHQDLIKTELGKVFVENGKTASIETKTKGSSYFLEISTNFMRGDESETASGVVKEALIRGLDNCTEAAGAYKIQESRTVSPTVSQELISSSTIAIVLSLLIIFAYILIRFGRWQYSTGAIIAMMHDVTVVLALFALLHGILPFNMDIDQAFIAAILTVIGYSINDTVIVFDRIRENLKAFQGTDEKENINKSLNSTLSRTINTSMTTFIVLLIIFIFGGAAIKGFIFALMIGVIVGTYSSVCIATPVLIDFSKRVKKVAE